MAFKKATNYMLMHNTNVHPHLEFDEGRLKQSEIDPSVICYREELGWSAEQEDKSM